MQGAEEYRQRLMRVLEALPVEVIGEVAEALWRARSEGKTIFLCGNGGSASTASHIACDLGKGTARPGRPRFRILALTDNIPTMTAYANDVSYADIFVEQLKNLFQPGDVVIGISGSGNSENVLRAVRYARERGGLAIGFTGGQGGRLKGEVDLCLIVPSEDLQQIEDVHLMVGHILMQEFCRRMAREAL